MICSLSCVSRVWDYRSSFFFFQAEDGIRDLIVTGVQTCALPIFPKDWRAIVEAWLDERKPAAFKPPPKIDHGKVWDTLSAGVDRDKLATVTSALVEDRKSVV